MAGSIHSVLARSSRSLMNFCRYNKKNNYTYLTVSSKYLFLLICLVEIACRRRADAKIVHWTFSNRNSYDKFNSYSRSSGNDECHRCPCPESRQCPHQWLRTVGNSDTHHSAESYTLSSLRTYRRIKQLLQLIVEPHLNGQPLADQAHLVRSVLGCQELLAALLDRLSFFAEVDAQSGPIRRALAIVQGLQAALHGWTVINGVYRNAETETPETFVVRLSNYLFVMESPCICRSVVLSICTGV